MPFRITDLCDKSRACLDVCPVGCIRDFGDQIHIDESEWIDCALCLPACPLNAIIQVPDA